MEEILIVSNYYPPEKGAAANRIEQLALKLSENKYKVSVVCPLANYPEGKIFPKYKNKFHVRETLKGISVSRLWIYPSNSKNIFVRVISILSFSTGLFLYLLFKNTPHKVVVQSPPLLLSFISVFVLSLKGKKIILNVSDLWPLAAIELDALKTDTLSHRFSLFLEKYIYRKATLVLGQSNEIITHVREIYPSKPCYLYRNFPDHGSVELISNANQDGPIKLFYAGLLGVAQGVFEICEGMKLEGLNIEFHIFGDGAEKNMIEKYISKHPEKNIKFHGMLERSELIKRLADFDIAFVPLKKRIYGSVPSKIFEYGALGIPILYFGGGEGEDIVSENDIGWVAKVGDFENLNTKLLEISLFGRMPVRQMRESVLKTSEINFNLDLQMKQLIEKGIF